MRIFEGGFNSIISEIDKGIKKENTGIPILIDKCKNNLYVSKGMYNIVAGSPASGKTSFADLFGVISPYENYLKNPDKDFHVLYFSLERSPIAKITKWLCLKTMLDGKGVYDVETLFNWNGRSVISEETKKVFDSNKDWLEGLLKKVTIFDGSINPTGIYKLCIEYLKNNGTEIRNEQSIGGKIVNSLTDYIPNNNQTVIIMVDHLNALKSEKELNLKGSIEKCSEYLKYFRDHYRCSIMPLVQMNRNMADPLRKKQGDVIPRKDDLKDSSKPFEDADRAIGILDPLEFEILNFYNYEPKKFVTSKGVRRFRSITIFKNSYGVSGISYGLAFYGETGLYEGLPSSKSLTDDKIAEIKNKYKTNY